MIWFVGDSGMVFSARMGMGISHSASSQQDHHHCLDSSPSSCAPSLGRGHCHIPAQTPGFCLPLSTLSIHLLHKGLRISAKHSLIISTFLKLALWLPFKSQTPAWWNFRHSVPACKALSPLPTVYSSAAGLCLNHCISRTSRPQSVLPPLPLTSILVLGTFTC